MREYVFSLVRKLEGFLFCFISFRSEALQLENESSDVAFLKTILLRKYSYLIFEGLLLLLALFSQLFSVALPLLTFLVELIINDFCLL